ncbi:solute carrier family 23 member 3 [Pangasianodon hypophthalmus]|uniref:solute carrier family 23 member 3 n=1 Tax=Pangasianodon hypophthalmus TaxID=310915 RepID=UPI000EFFCBCC|nr:solute carrier family 23 member 3 [Pangasianodon hypophthalmus]XP_034160341.2 solute carrier family 23 member 3 [Pangasianodon hypophthalmus]
MVKPDRCKWMAACPQQDFTEADTLKSLKVDRRPPLLLNIALALQHVMVHASLCALVVGALVPQAEKERTAASVFFYSGVSTLLQTCFGSRLPLIQAPSLDFLVPALVLLCAQAGSHAACRGQCDQSEQFEVQAHQLRELQGMAVVAGLVQLSVGLCGVGGAMLTRCGPLVLTPVCCMLGFSIYREAALLCSDHWGFALLTVVLLVCLSQHLRCWTLSAHLKLPLYPAVSMLSVLLSVLLVWGVCAALQHCGHITPHSVSELLFKDDLNTAPFQNWTTANSSNLLSPNSTAAWFSLPLPGLGLPLLSGDSIAAGVAAGLSSSISSQAVYVLTARLLKAPTPPAQACNRGVSVEGLSSVLAGLMGVPVGLCSSVPNACMTSLSQCGSRATVQLAAVMLLVLGLFLQLTQLLTSVPLAIHGAVLSVTYTVAAATGITYLQYTDVDSGRNIFNTGFTVFMSLVLPRWFRMQSGFIYTGVRSLDIFLQSCLMLPVFLVSLLAFLLDHTVSGTLSERGLELDQSTRKIQSLADKPQENSQSLVTVYEPPQPVRKVLDWPGLRDFPFCACRSLEVEKITVSSAEMSSLLPQ